MGQIQADTIKLLGRAGSKEIVILLDSESTHNCLNPQTASKLGCVVEYTRSSVVIVVDGNKMECNSRCPQFEWRCEGVSLAHL